MPRLIWCAVLVVFFSSFSFGQSSEPKVDDLTSRAIEGAKLLYSDMRDPDTFTIDKVWIMKSQKHGYSICYTYYARNGFGGMNHSSASYWQITNKKYVARTHVEYRLDDDSENMQQSTT